jgi:hypothetical protein
MIQALGAALGWPQDGLYSAGVEPFYVVGRPGFIGAFGQWLDIFTPLNWNYSVYFSESQAMADTFYLDWYMVGQDLTNATFAYQKSLKGDATTTS